MLRKLNIFLACWAVAGVAAAIALVVLEPTGLLKWGLWAIAVVPAGLIVNAVVEGTAHLFMSLPGMKQGTKYFEGRAAGRKFSAARAAWYGFAAVLGFVVIISLSVAAWGAYSAIAAFFAQDKCLDHGGRWHETTQACEHQTRVSSPRESHPQALPEPDVNLSIHPAPIVQSS